MSQPSLCAVGAPPSFRQQVATALDRPAEAVHWMHSATDFQDALSQHPGPDVLVISPDMENAEAFQLAQHVSTVSPATATILVRHHELNGLLPTAMRAGVRDVVDLSRGSDELADALGRAFGWSESLRSLRNEHQSAGSTKLGRVISVFSSKGGTGKTFIACNLAAAIAASPDQKTALVDLDLGMGDVFSYYGGEPLHPFQDLISLGDMADKETVLAAATPLGDHLWGFGAPPDPSAEKVSGDAISRSLKSLQTSFDVVVADVGADYSDQALAAFDVSDVICLVTSLDVVGVKHLAKALETLVSIGCSRDRFRIVLNRADSDVGIKTEDVEHVLKLKVDAHIPSSRLVPTSLNKGRPVVLDQPRSDVAKSINELADKVAGSRQDTHAVQRESGATGKRFFGLRQGGK